MKILMNRLVVVLVFLFAVFVIVSFASNKSSKKEVLFIESYISFEPEGYGLAIYHKEKSTERILVSYKSGTNELKENENILDKFTEKKGRMISNTLQRFYDDGWKLEGTNGGDDFQRYILTR